MRKILAIAVCAIAGLTAQAEVTSLTLGIDVNSPYGISEPWVTIREALLRLDYVESVANLPDRQSATGEMRTKNGRVPDVDALAKALRESGAGATLRGAEAKINGSVTQQGNDFVLKVSKTARLSVWPRLPNAFNGAQRKSATASAARSRNWFPVLNPSFAKCESPARFAPVPLLARSKPSKCEFLNFQAVLRTKPTTTNLCIP